MSRWNKLNRPLILASNSPRRRDILSQMGFVFSVCSPNVKDEMSFFNNPPFEKAIQSLALAKAESVASMHPDSLVLGGDTIVCLGNKIMGKPINREDASQMLHSLSGTVHEVYSGIALVCRGGSFIKTISARTEVTFRTLEDDEIDLYLDCKEYTDKAGAYAIQGKALSLIQGISGCFYNVVGLPVSETIHVFLSYINRKDSGYDRQQPH